jgi:hypothetical protein
MQRSLVFAGLVVLAGMLAQAGAGDACCDEKKPAVGAKESSSRFERLKGLAGDWQIASSHDAAQKGKIAARYHLTAGGSALVETIFPGEEMEMVTVYHRDGDQILLTHYCHIGNQPRMRTIASEANDELVFEFAGGSNLNPAADTHMHDALIRFVDADHLHTEWELYQKGKAAQKYKFDLVRVK